ncbi:MAG: hypothetical protein M3Q49_00800 [Actinomycetota bacterium]|nr:hypothetical protein [Actinomycetota bacterium]
MGKTPVLKENLTRDHLSAAMSGITLEGKLYMIEQERAFKKGEDAVRFLRHLMRQIEGKLLVIWDGSSPIHRSRSVKDFLASSSGAAARLQLEQLPATLRSSTPTRGSGSTSTSAWS